jgi:hypothetical protein
VAHAISVVVLQARGGRKLLAAEPAAARRSTRSSRSAGRR